VKNGKPPGSAAFCIHLRVKIVTLPVALQGSRLSSAPKSQVGLKCVKGFWGKANRQDGQMPQNGVRNLSTEVLQQQDITPQKGIAIPILIRPI